MAEVAKKVRRNDILNSLVTCTFAQGVENIKNTKLSGTQISD